MNEGVVKILISIMIFLAGAILSLAGLDHGDFVYLFVGISLIVVGLTITTVENHVKG